MPGSASTGRMGGLIRGPMARSSIALFLASTTLIAGLAGCGGEGAGEKTTPPADGAPPAVSAPEGGEGSKEEMKEKQGMPSPSNEGGEGGEGGEG